MISRLKAFVSEFAWDFVPVVVAMLLFCVVGFDDPEKLLAGVLAWTFWLYLLYLERVRDLEKTVHIMYDHYDSMFGVMKEIAGDYYYEAVCKSVQEAHHEGKEA